MLSSRMLLRQPWMVPMYLIGHGFALTQVLSNAL